MIKQSKKGDQELENLIKQDKLSKIKNKIVVLSGKGGVGKSTISVNIATFLASKGYKTGLIDVDIHGPSIPTLLNLVDTRLHCTDTVIIPKTYGDNLKVVSIGFLLQSMDDAIIWRGPAKNTLIKQFIEDVEWGELDFLIIDCPPGTGDEPLSVVQTLENTTGAVIVTTPQKVSLNDVRKSINFCKKLDVPIIGIVENMSGYCCPECHKTTNIFTSGGGEQMAKDLNIDFLGKIPIDPIMVLSGDMGEPFILKHSGTHTANDLQKTIENIENYCCINIS